jgi:hypothetical protein
MLDLTTARAERYRSDNGRYYDYTLETLHRLLSLVLAVAISWVPVWRSQIKDGGRLVALFQPC